MAQTANERLLDEIISHAVDLHRYSYGVLRRIIAVLNGADQDLLAALQTALDRLPASQFRADFLESLLGSVRQINADAYSAAFGALQDDMRALAGHEVGFERSAFESAIPAEVFAKYPFAGISTEQAYAAALSRPFQGRLLKDWASNAEANRLTTIRNAVRMGYVEGRTTDEIIRDIRGTRAARFTDGRLDQSRRGLASIVQTALGHTSAVAREETYKANADLIKAVRWVSVLDNRTSSMCRIRDGLRYSATDHKPIGHSVPWLGGPGRLHFCCRSTAAPVTASYRELGLDIGELSPSTRASMDGQVPADTTYGEWLTKQSAARQDDILGPTRGKLMREKGLTLQQLYTPRGDPLTIEQLQERTDSRFAKAA